MAITICGTMDGNRVGGVSVAATTNTAGKALDEADLRRVLDVGLALVSELDVEVLLRHILEAARDLTTARYAAVGVLDSEHASWRGSSTPASTKRRERRSARCPAAWEYSAS